jgi:hypothetical protein
MPCTNEQCGKFFDELDRITIVSPPPTPMPELGRQVEVLRPLLRDRLTKRAGGNPLPGTNAEQQAAARTVADRFVALLKTHFPREPDPPGIDLDCVQTCFVRFAYGELRTGATADPRGPAREPNGPGQFLFTEYALLVLELNLEPQRLWTALLRTFAKSNKVFIKAYPPQEGGPGGTIWRPREFRRPPELTDKERRRLHDEFQDVPQDEVEERFNDTLREANGQPSVAFLPRQPLDPDGLQASLHYAQLLTAMLKRADLAPSNARGVAQLAQSVKQLLTLEPTLGPDTMPRRHEFLGSPGPADEYFAARCYVAATLAAAKHFLELVDRKGPRMQHRNPPLPGRRKGRKA